MTDCINKIKLKELITICQIVEDSEGDIEYVKTKYELYGGNFPENMSFLIGLDLIKESSGVYTINKIHLKAANDEKDIKMKIVENLLSKKSVYGEVLYKYVNNFRPDNDEYKYKPRNIERIKYSSIRNLLIELDIVFESEESGEYVFNDRYIPYIYVSSEKYDLAWLERNLENKAIIGYEAELLILNYEKIRIANFPIKDLAVEHTSQANVIAGYDIKSWTYKERAENCVPRYIEVKAIPSINLRFYWTRNEIEQSEILNENYYLYLLPVDVSTGFDIDKLKIIRDPFNEVLNSKNWNVDTEVYRITSML